METSVFDLVYIWLFWDLWINRIGFVAEAVVTHTSMSEAPASILNLTALLFLPAT